jgi:hypothetical protein
MTFGEDHPSILAAFDSLDLIRMSRMRLWRSSDENGLEYRLLRVEEKFSAQFQDTQQQFTIDRGYDGEEALRHTLKILQKSDDDDESRTDEERLRLALSISLEVDDDDETDQERLRLPLAMSVETVKDETGGAASTCVCYVNRGGRTMTARKLVASKDNIRLRKRVS